MQRPHLGVVGFRQRKIRVVQRVLGIDRAADIAIAAVHTCALLDTLCVMKAFAVREIERVWPIITIVVVE